jgi:hypothetical protein
MEYLHTYNDGSCLYRTSARALCCVPIWKGNRIIDMEHVKHLSLVKLYSVEAFVTICRNANEALLQAIQEHVIQSGTNGTDKVMAKKMIELRFALAWDDKFRWLPIQLKTVHDV